MQKWSTLTLFAAVGLVFGFSILIATNLNDRPFLLGLIFGGLIVACAIAAVWGRWQLRADASEGANARASIEQQTNERVDAERERTDTILLRYLEMMERRLEVAENRLLTQTTPAQAWPALSAPQQPIERLQIDGRSVPKRDLPEELANFAMVDGTLQTYPVNLIDSFFRCMDPQPNREQWTHGNGSYGTTARFIARMHASPLAEQGHTWQWTLPHQDALAWWEQAIEPWMVARGFFPSPTGNTVSYA